MGPAGREEGRRKDGRCERTRLMGADGFLRGEVTVKGERGMQRRFSALMADDYGVFRRLKLAVSGGCSFGASYQGIFGKYLGQAKENAENIANITWIAIYYS